MRKINKSGIIPLTLQNAPVPNAPDQVKASIYKAEVISWKINFVNVLIVKAVLQKNIMM